MSTVPTTRTWAAGTRATRTRVARTRATRPWSRRLAAAATTGIVATALALAGATGASAAESGSWGSFEVSGSARAYSGTMTLGGGFPATTFTSTSRQTSVPSGSSTWQAPATPPGALYGSSKGSAYLNQRPAQDTPNPAGAAVTTYLFASPTPTAGWSFVLGDIDADQVTITATDPDGALVPAEALGFQGGYNYCRQAGGPSCDSAAIGDVPRWDAATGTLTGNAAAADTEGAAGWFSPSVPLGSLTISFQQRSGFPIYQTWFATRTVSASGTATIGEGTDAVPYAGAAVTVTDAAGRVVAVTETRADGTYSVPALVAAPGYRVAVAPPAGAEPADPLGFSLQDGDRAGLDVVFTTSAGAPATTTASGVITDSDGQPAAGRELSIIAEGATEPSDTEVTDADGRYTFAGLDPAKNYALVDVPTGNSTEFVAPAGLGNRMLPPEPVTVEVTGTILGPDGTPAAGQTVDIIPVPTVAGVPSGAQPTGPDASVVTDENGAFTADGLIPSAEYVAIVGDDAENPIHFTAPAAGEPVTPLELEVPTPNAVSVDGTVVSSRGVPVPDIEVSVLPPSSSTPLATTMTDADGRFVFDGLVPGSGYRLSIEGIEGTTGFSAFADTGLGVFALPAPVVAPPGAGGGPGSTGPGGSGPEGAAPGSGAPGAAASGGSPAGTGGARLAATGGTPVEALALAGLLLASGLLVAGARATRPTRASG